MRQAWTLFDIPFKDLNTVFGNKSHSRLGNPRLLASKKPDQSSSAKRGATQV